eukprot:6187498-Pleurochrysis_carterae.AAC.1
MLDVMKINIFQLRVAPDDARRRGGREDVARARLCCVRTAPWIAAFGHWGFRGSCQARAAVVERFGDRASLCKVPRPGK